MKRLLAVAWLFFAHGAICQTTTQPVEVLENTTFIHSEDLDQFSAAELAKLNGNYIVFDGELTKERMVELFNEKQSTKVNSLEITQKPLELDFVKNWISENPDVKIIPQSTFQGSSENEQNEFVKTRCLILSGEVITREDILNY